MRSLNDYSTEAIIKSMGNWKMVTANPELANDEVMHRLFDEAMASAPSAYVQSDKGIMLPRKPVTEKCALCGTIALLTKEHIPPKASGNKFNMSKYTLDDWLNRTSITDLPTRKINQGGVFGYTLCQSCNSLTGSKYGGAYKKWATQANRILKNFDPNGLDGQSEMIHLNVKMGFENLEGFQPGAVVRQVLSMLCSLSGGWNLAERHPELREIILHQRLAQLPVNIDLGFALYFGPKSRIIGPQLVMNRSNQSWQWVMEVAHPPFAFWAVIASNQNDAGRGLTMNDWTTLYPGEKKKLEGIVQLGFGWSPHPGEYRTSTALKQNVQWR